MTRVRRAADLKAVSLLHETASLCARDGVELKVCLTAVLAAAIESPTTGRCRHLPSRNVHAVDGAWGRDRLGGLRV